MSAVFLIVVYCLHADRCYVSQDVPGGPHKYATTHACEMEIPGKIPDADPAHPHPSREIHKNSSCVAVTDVSCVNGGSVCSFTPADDKAAEMLKAMVVIPK